MATATASAPSSAPTASHTTPTPAGSPVALDNNVIGTISGSAIDAAPVGGPVPDGAFSDLVPAPAPSGAAALGATTVAGAVAAAGVVGSFFF
ncbi:hypothetical protein BUALT_Bualt05G0165900 [Buddleja alternifolia]|uniref:Uncharacterized protein n=1 Tax=Buddleja alternifolia TaxID=168488 RepID=A0AAV6XVJ8_9LAMI|nr:hypothetical protein BUALT_Bualt05G0165900 [Buddleja alternifolia]